MDAEQKEKEPTLKPTPVSVPLIGRQQQLLTNITLTAKTVEEAEAQVVAYEKINQIHHKMLLSKHKLELDKQDRRHQQRMDVLRFVVPCISGLILATLGVVLIYNLNPTIQYMGVSLLFIGACALIPGISKVLTNIGDMIKGLHAIAQETRRVAAEIAEMEKKKN